MPQVPPSAWVGRLGARLARRFGRSIPASVAWARYDSTAAWLPVPPGARQGLSYPQTGELRPQVAGHPDLGGELAEAPGAKGAQPGLPPQAGGVPLPPAGHPDLEAASPGSTATTIGLPAPAGEPQATTWIGRSWALPTSGPQAPLDLLLRLAGETLAAAAVGRAPEAASDARPHRHPLLRSQGQRTPSGVAAWDTPFSHAPRQAAPEPETQVPPGAAQGFYPQAGSLPLPAAGQPNFRPPLAPPVASETPPTLLAPQAAYDAPTAYAAASLQQAGRQDEQEKAPEDLDRLAERIKRILDDEARRYGIPV